MSIDNRNNSPILSEPQTVSERGESPGVSPERDRPLAQLLNYCTNILKRPEARKRILVSTSFIKKGLDRYSQTDF